MFCFVWLKHCLSQSREMSLPEAIQPILAPCWERFVGQRHPKSEHDGVSTSLPNILIHIHVQMKLPRSTSSRLSMETDLSHLAWFMETDFSEVFPPEEREDVIMRTPLDLEEFEGRDFWVSV